VRQGSLGEEESNDLTQDTAETSRRDPARVRDPRPAKPGQQPEASLANRRVTLAGVKRRQRAAWAAVNSPEMRTRWEPLL
jgi:hypothetical protein